jgi:glycosyltransferase involved in cell wall biosynthesis
MPKHKILVVSYAYPTATTGPRASVGGERVRQFVRHLPHHGFDPVVITHRGARTPPTDDSVLLAPDLMRWLAESVPRARRRASGGSPGGGFRFEAARVALRRLTFPDRSTYAWAPQAFLAALRAARSVRPSIVMSSSPPVSNHVVAAALARSLGIPWVADYRDGFSFEPPEGESPIVGLRRAFDRYVVGHAARVVCVTDPLCDDLQKLAPGREDHVVTITNGYDPDLVAQVEEAPRDPDGPFRVLFAGTTGLFRKGIRLRTVVDAFMNIARSRDAGLLLMGYISPDDVGPHASSAQVEVRGWVERPQVMREMRRADALVVLTGNDTSVAGSKLFDYIGAARPVLVVGRRTAAGEIVRRHGFGLVAEDDVESIEAALRDLCEHRAEWTRRLSSPEMAEARLSYSRFELTGKLAEVFRDVLNGSPAGG